MTSFITSFYIKLKINRALYYIALFIFSINILFSEITPLESKFLWILRDSLTSPEKIEKAFSFASNSGFNKVFIQVRGRGYAFYNSTLVPKNPLVNVNFDPLEYAIQLGKRYNLEVHIWFNTYILWSSNYKPKNLNHIYHTQKSWTEANTYGKMDHSINLKSPKIPNWEGIYLSPLHPDVNPYLNSLIKEIIENYNIDGIHFDYIRYQDEIYGYNEQGRNKFEKLYSIDPSDIAKGIISTRFGWSQEFVDSTKNMWNKFRQDAITEFLESISESVTNSNKNIQLSAAVKPNLLTAKKRFFQNWDSWLNDGLLDFVVPMNYYSEFKYFNDDLKMMKFFIDEKLHNRIVMGVATYNQSSEDAADKILISRLNGFVGVSIFSYDAHKNNLDWFYPVIHAINYSKKE